MKNFYRNFLKLCSMLVLQNVVTLSVNLADNIMLGEMAGYTKEWNINGEDVVFGVVKVTK